MLLRGAKDPKEIPDTVELIRGFVWARDLVLGVGSGPIIDFTHCVKSTRISKDKIESFRKLCR